MNELADKFRPQAEASADWWRDVMRGPKQDNGDGLQSALMTVMGSSIPGPTDEQLSVFRDALAAAIEVEMMHNPRWLHVGVDYGPDPLLADAARAAGIHVGILGWPSKTNMRIKPGEYTSVSYGYRAEDVTIWGEDKAAVPCTSTPDPQP